MAISRAQLEAEIQAGAHRLGNAARRALATISPRPSRAGDALRDPHMSRLEDPTCP
jgi:hypothetical protein